jgi:ketosteroid isomerase-like protein
MKKLLLLVFAAVVAASASGQAEATLDEDKEAIKAVIQEETQSYCDKDFDRYAATYKHDESIVDLRAYMTNYSQALGWENKGANMKNFMENNPEPIKNTEVKQNFRIHVNGDCAWAIFDNLSYAEDGTLDSQDVGVNFLEKIDGKWKIVYLSRVGVSTYSGGFEQIEVSDEVISRYLGKYELQPGFILDFRLEDGHFYVYPTGQMRQELFPYEENKFFLMTVNAQIEFQMEEGKAVSLTLHQNGEYPARKIE